MDFTEIITLVLSGTTVGGAVSALFYRRQNKALKNNEVAVSTVEAKRSQMDLVEDYEKKVLELCNSTYEQTKANSLDNQKIIGKVDAIYKEQQQIVEYLDGDYQKFLKSKGYQKEDTE